MRWLTRTLLCLTAGCSPCSDDGPSVPFKLGPSGAGGAASAASSGGSAAPEAPQSYAAGTRSIELAGHTLSTPEHDIRAAVALRLDGDERVDALLALVDASGRPMLAHAVADADGLGALELADSLVAADVSCAVESLQLSRLGSALLRVSGMLACANAQSAAAVGDTSASTAPAEHAAPPAPPEPGEPLVLPAGVSLPPAEPHEWLLRVEATPTVLEELRIGAAADASEPAIGVSWQAADLDQDGHEDVSLTLTLSIEGDEPSVITLPLFDRPGGLARDGKEPEASWMPLADEAKTTRKSQPQRSAILAGRVTRAHRALCRESGHARVWLHGERGLSCGPSLAAGRAATIEIALLARKGQVLEALERHAQLDGGAYRLTDNDRERASYALSERVSRDALQWRRGPLLRPPVGPKARRSALAFLDEGRLLLRQSSGAQVLDLASLALEPAGEVPGLLVTSPDGKLALRALATGCEGVQAQLVNASQVVSGIVAGTDVAAPLVLTSAREGECFGSDGAGDVELIDWTEAGLVLAQGRTLYVVPLDGAGSVAAPATQLAASSAPAGLRYPSRLTPDGRTQLIPTALGIALHERSSGMARVLAWPSDVSASSVTDLALSPSGQRVALLAGGTVYLGEPAQAVSGAAAPPHAPPHPPPAPPEPSDGPAAP